MTGFNKNVNVTTALDNREDAIRNNAGGKAFDLSPKLKLYQTSCTTMVGEQKYYKSVVNKSDGTVNISGTTDELIVETAKQVAKEDPEYILSLAEYTRNTLNLRSISIMLLVEAANMLEFKTKPRQESIVKKYVPLIIKRADEITEVLAYQINKFGRSIPHALLRGLRDTFPNFDAYNFAKYNRDKVVKFKDALRIVHPIPKDEETSKMYKDILEDTLSPPETWEVILSDWKGKGYESKKAAWEHIVNEVWLKDERIRNYMAILRNLRNLLEEEVCKETIIKIANAIKNKDAVLKSKQFPFRFYSAYRMLQNIQSPLTTILLDAIEEALEVSTQNLPKFDGTTFLVADNSGSMTSKISEKSIISMQDIACLNLAMANRHCEYAITSVFANRFAQINLPRTNSIMSNMGIARSTNVGYCTNGYKAMEYLIENNIKVDRIIFFTDMQMYNLGGSGLSIASLLRKYKSSINSNVYTYVIDLTGYGNTVFPEDEKNVCLLAGWSERFIEFIKAYEQDSSSAVSMIEANKLSRKNG